MIQESRPIKVTSTGGYVGEFPSIKNCVQILFKGNILIYRSVVRVLKSQKKTPINHEKHGNLYFWYKN